MSCSLHQLLGWMMCHVVFLLELAFKHNASHFGLSSGSSFCCPRCVKRCEQMAWLIKCMSSVARPIAGSFEAFGGRQSSQLHG